MKCPVCKYLNCREEMRKHLNETTLHTLALATASIRSLPEVARGVIMSNCQIHSKSAVLTNHLSSIGAFATELKALLADCPIGVPYSKLKSLLEKYPRPADEINA